MHTNRNIKLTDFRHFSSTFFSLFLSFLKKNPAGRMFVSVSVSVSSGGETKDFETAKKKLFFLFFHDFYWSICIVASFCVYGYNLCALSVTVRQFPEKWPGSLGA